MLPQPHHDGHCSVCPYGIAFRCWLSTRGSLYMNSRNSLGCLDTLCFEVFQLWTMQPGLGSSHTRGSCCSNTICCSCTPWLSCWKGLLIAGILVHQIRTDGHKRGRGQPSSCLLLPTRFHFSFSRLLWLLRVLCAYLQIVKQFCSNSVKNVIWNLIGISLNL